MNLSPTSPAENGSAAGLPACSWRMPTRLPGTYYCRHSSVHSLNDLVDSTICRVCNQAALPARLPRPVLSDPLAPRKKYTASEELEYISLERLAADVRRLVSQLPHDLAGVAGIPRSGMLPATQIAMALHVPLWELSQRHGLRAIGNGRRLEGQDLRAGPLLIVDDSVCSGAALEMARNVLRSGHPEVNPLFAAIYPVPHAIPSLDFHAYPLNTPHLFEWNLFNCLQAKAIAMDFDGIFCADWPGGDEEDGAYQTFLETAAPFFLPRYTPVPLIVTARLEKHRSATESWLKRHRVGFQKLVMGPWKSAQERSRLYHAGEYKGREYAQSNCRLFIESNEHQARLIFEAAQKPVLCPSAEKVFQ